MKSPFWQFAASFFSVRAGTGQAVRVYNKGSGKRASAAGVLSETHGSHYWTGTTQKNPTQVLETFSFSPLVLPLRQNTPETIGNRG